ncbi:hypothetical protein [Sulfitobacter dubius]|uniref:hypothetical protein n=1 Tax=Sulfitobacter dubius TaxID=218673 RepID=UPI0008E147AF|nr:hypothetical protein [Sulfitobacter dubius]SFH37763.1 hypothetical protein SAMN04488039_1104 [Sulfitobacter dubius]
MSVGVTLKQRGTSESEGVQAVSNMSLGTPADISLARGTPAIVASDKLGSDLALSFSDGKTLLVRDFFVIGEEGDFSRLLLPNGEAFVTGLMGPEPSYTTDGNAQGSVEAGSEAESEVLAGLSEVQDGAGESMDWSSPLLFAGTGLSLGAGVNLLSGNDEEEAPVLAQSEAQAFSLAVEEVIGAASDTLERKDYDPEAPSTEVETDETPEGATMKDSDPADDATKGAFVGDANLSGAEIPMKAGFQHDLPPELMTEFVG